MQKNHWKAKEENKDTQKEALISGCSTASEIPMGKNITVRYSKSRTQP